MNLAPWVLRLMLALGATEPPSPWLSTYDRTAIEIADAAPDVETAAVLVAIGWNESRFNPDAVHRTSRARGVWQISPHWRDYSARMAVFLVLESQIVCRKAKPGERLAWYAQGGAGCDPRGFAISRHRMALASRLLRDIPFE